MSEFHVREEYMVAAIPAAVWKVLTDLDAKARLPGVVEIERLRGPEYGVGTRWRETRRTLGITSSEEMEVTAIASGWAATIEARSRGVRYATEFSLAWRQDGTALAMSRTGRRVEGVPRVRLLARLARPLGVWAIRRAMRRDLEALAVAARLI